MTKAVPLSLVWTQRDAASALRPLWRMEQPGIHHHVRRDAGVCGHLTTSGRRHPYYGSSRSISVHETSSPIRVERHSVERLEVAAAICRGGLALHRSSDVSPPLNEKVYLLLVVVSPEREARRPFARIQALRYFGNDRALEEPTRCLILIQVVGGFEPYEMRRQPSNNTGAAETRCGSPGEWRAIRGPWWVRCRSRQPANSR